MTHRSARQLLLLPITVGALLIGPSDPVAAQQSDTEAPLQAAQTPDGGSAATPPDGITTVKVDIYINEILDINERDNTFRVNARLSAQWLDKRVVGATCDEPGTAKVYDGEAAIEHLKTDIWSPGFYVVDARDPRETSATAVTVWCDGTVQYDERFVATVVQRFYELHDFPFDDHQMSFSIAPFAAAEAANIIFAPLYANVAGDNAFGSDDWETEEWDFSVKFADQQVVDTPPRITTVIDIDRKGKYYWLNIIGPLLMIVAISWTVFWMNLNLAERLGVSIAILLTVVAFDFLTSDNLPRLSYTTRLDQFYNVSYALVALTVLVSVIATRPSFQTVGTSPDGEPDSEPDSEPDDKKQEKRVKQNRSRGATWDARSRAGFPAVYSAFVVAALLGLLSPGPNVPSAQADDMDIADDIDTRLGGAVGLEIGSSVNAMITNPGEHDDYRLCAPSEDDELQFPMSLAVTMARIGEVDDVLDPYLVVSSELDDLVTEDDDGAGGLDSRVVLLAEPDECFLVIAGDPGQNTGEYRLTATEVDPDEGFVEVSDANVELDLGVTVDELRARAEGLQPDELVIDTLDGDFDPYSFCVDSNGVDELSITMKTTDGAFDPVVRVYSEDGSFVTDDDDGAGGLNSLAIVDSPAGCYLIIATGFDQGQGDYELTATTGDVDLSDIELDYGASFDRLLGEALTLDLPIDDSLRGVLERPDQIDFYRFCSSDVGEFVEVTMQRTGGPDQLANPFLVAYDADGTFVGFDDLIGDETVSQLSFDPLPAGCYLIGAGDLLEATGAYELTATTDR